jgi:hypothetical protein
MSLKRKFRIIPVASHIEKAIPTRRIPLYPGVYSSDGGNRLTPGCAVATFSKLIT